MLNGVLEREFHPRAEYGGRRCTVIVSTVGKVENISSSNGVPKLRDLGAEEYKSAEKLGKTRRNDFAPLDGATGGAKAATFLVKSEEKDDGSLYFYEWRSQALLNFHFWEVAVLGPGPKRCREEVREERHYYGEMSNAGRWNDARGR